MGHHPPIPTPCSYPITVVVVVVGYCIITEHMKTPMLHLYLLLIPTSHLDRLSCTYVCLRAHQYQDNRVATFRSNTCCLVIKILSHKTRAQHLRRHDGKLNETHKKKKKVTSRAFSLSDIRSCEWRLERQVVWLVHSERSLSNSFVFSVRV